MATDRVGHLLSGDMGRRSDRIPLRFQCESAHPLRAISPARSPGQFADHGASRAVDLAEVSDLMRLDTDRHC